MTRYWGVVSENIVRLARGVRKYDRHRRSHAAGVSERAASGCLAARLSFRTLRHQRRRRDGTIKLPQLLRRPLHALVSSHLSGRWTKPLNTCSTLLCRFVDCLGLSSHASIIVSNTVSVISVESSTLSLLKIPRRDPPRDPQRWLLEQQRSITHPSSEPRSERLC